MVDAIRADVARQRSVAEEERMVSYKQPPPSVIIPSQQFSLPSHTFTDIGATEQTWGSGVRAAIMNFREYRYYTNSSVSGAVSSIVYPLIRDYDSQPWVRLGEEYSLNGPPISNGYSSWAEFDWGLPDNVELGIGVKDGNGTEDVRVDMIIEFR